MRLILLLALAPLLGAAPATPPLSEPTVPSRGKMPALDPQQLGPDCPETPMSLARREGERARAIPLNRMPDAQSFAAVDRRVDGCPAPMLMSEVRR